MADQVITIRHNDKDEIFDIEDVNPENLKDHFGIEVKSLKNCQTGKVVFVKSTNIKLSVGATYEITSTSSPNTTTDKDEQQAETFDQKWLDENQKTVQNALIASLASYETDAKDYLDSRLNYHSLKSVVQSVNGDCSFIMAESDDKKTVYVDEKTVYVDKKTVYVAFRGTNSWEDLITDFHIHRKKTQSPASRGKVHSGFLKRADAFPLMTVSEFLVGKKVVVCGHSLGGAISSLVFCHLLSREQQLRKLEICDDIINITFGSPLFADSEFRNFLNDEIKEMTPRPQMYHFVAENDIVPSLLCLAQSVPFLKENFQKPLAELQNFPLIRMLTPVLSAGLGIAALLDRNKADTYGSLNEYIDILKAEENKLSKKFVPIGNYILLCENEPKFVHCSNSNEVLPYLDIFSSFSLENTDNHQLELYEEKCTLGGFIKKDAFRDDEGSARSETLKLEKFAPEISKGELLWEKYDLKKDLKLNLHGKNITCICLQHCNFNFGTLFVPEVIHSAENEVILHQPSFKEEISPSEHGLHITIATVFGSSEYTLPVSAIKNIEVPIIMKFSKEARPMQILKTAFQRGVALSDMSDIPALRNSLIKDIETLSKLALKKSKYEEFNLILKKANKELQKCLNSKSEHKKLMSFLKDITQELESGLKLEAPIRHLQILGIAIFTMLGGLAGFYFAGRGYFLLEAARDLGLPGVLGSAGGGFSGYGLSRMYNSTYAICLQFVVSELFEAWSKRNQSRDELRVDIAAFKNRGGLYNLEKALFLMFDPEIGKEIFEDCSLKDMSDSCKDDLLKRIKCFIQMHELRESLATQCFIGVIGPQDAGKSTFLNKMWNCGAKVGLNIHTEKTTLYNINKKIKLVDFPGDNSFQEHSKAFSICGASNNITVVILPFTGDVSQLVSDELTKVYKAVADSSDSRVIVCINQCGDKLIQLAGEEVRLRKEGAETTNPLELLRSNYISKLNEYFESPSVESEPRQIIFDAENLFFTDFELDIHDPGLIQLAREEVRLRKEGAETTNPLELLRSNYTSKLNEYFESPSVESEPRQITFDAENLFFTDFELDIHDPRNTFGIVGVEEIKEALKKDLIDLGAIKSTDTEELEAAFKKLNTGRS